MLWVLKRSVSVRQFFSALKTRAYPGSDFVVASTLAKWKKLEPNEINFNQGFSQKVSSCFVLKSLHALSADHLCKQFGPRSGPTKVPPDLDPNCLTPRCY